MIKDILFTLYSLYIALRPSRLRLFDCLNKLDSIDHTTSLRILGNGNSLNEVLGNLKDQSYDYMVVNRYVLSESYESIKPRYYVLADPHFFNHEEGLSILSRIKEKTLWNMFLFIPMGANISALFVDCKNIHIIYYNTNEFRGMEKLKRYFYKHNIGLPRVQNVMVAAIYIAISVGYKKIELYGVEHSWTKFLFVNNKNEVCLDNPHFFDKERSKPKTWKEIQHENAYLHEILRMYAYMFESYIELEKMARTESVELLNCTKDSFIDAFKRKE